MYNTWTYNFDSKRSDECIGFTVMSGFFLYLKKLFILAKML